MREEIFALDIGTRKVMGIVGVSRDDYLEILDVEVIEHSSRPMLDAQIHSIDEVAKTVNLIKERLERRLNRKLDKVGVAVAGRNLLTYKKKVIREFITFEEITKALVRDLELEAVDRIISDSKENLSEFYCVGYSPVYYELDGNRISNLVGHRAKSIATEVIVTFLPRFVLDSIFAVLKKAKLEATNITLEPISAINAIIPPEMRNLNIILVDIGAGTSDLALAKEGVVFAYGMVTEAGDEITEVISENLLVDFSAAEKIKRSLDTQDEIEYEDIWSRRRHISAITVKTVLSPAVKKLANCIAQAGLDLNGGIPQAVVAVGGGSLTSNLMEELASSFRLPFYKVGIRLPRVIKGIKDKTGKLNGPEAVTPIGIALMAEKAQGLYFIEIEVNQKKVKMLDLQQKKDVMGALTLSGIINGKKLYPRPGLAITANVNSEFKVIKGTFGKPSIVMLNGRPIASLSDKIENGDKLEFEEAVDGQDASCVVGGFVQLDKVQINFNGEPQEIMPSVFMNDEEVNLDTPVSDRANIEVRDLLVIQVLKFNGINLDNLSERQILININGVPRILTQRNFTLRLNKQSCELNTEVKQKDVIEFSLDTPTFYKVKDVVDTPWNFQKMHINVDDKDIEVVIDTVQVFMNGHQVSPDEFLIDGADIRVYQAKDRKILLSEIFKYIDIDPQKVLGKRLRIFVDDTPAGFTTPLVEGSRVKILFEDRNNKII
jgi:cell division protein FtsA